jgi:hypothetical protein
LSRWAYPAELADALASLGLAPTSSTPPAFVRDAVSDLYRWELRAARDRLRAGLTEKSAYLDVVIALRKKYWMLTLPATAWDAICSAKV